MGKGVLITGGAGFIGANLAGRLLRRGYAVTVLDNLSAQVHGDDRQSDLYLSIKEKVTFVKGDVRNKREWADVLGDCDVIVHFAAETGTGQSMYDVSRYVGVNVQGTARLLQCLVNEKHRVHKVVVASSRAVYGEGKYHCSVHGVVYPPSRREQDLLGGQFECTCPRCGSIVTPMPTDEDSEMHPVSVYGITKQTQEQLVLTVCQSLGISAVALRYQNVYGPGQSLSNPYTGILSIFSTRIKNGKDINIFEDGKESRDFVYIDDVVDATVLSIEKTGIGAEVFNIGTGRPVSVQTVSNALADAFRSDVRRTVSGNFRAGDIRHNYADVSKAQRLLGFEPKYHFEAGISRFVEWANAQTTKGDGYERSLREMQVRGLFK